MDTKPHYYYEISEEESPQVIQTDICIYGATSSGICAAVQAASMNKKVALLAFNRHIGGMTTSGLGATDVGNKHVIGGLALRFYKEIGNWYDGRQREQWLFEPHVALKVFANWIQNKNITLFTECRLLEVQKEGEKIVSIKMEKGTTFKASVFIDSSYEGDLMAKAGVEYAVGREGNKAYNELYNGVQYSSHHNFKMFVDPYRKEGDSSSGLLPYISDMPVGVQGEGDKLIQAYNFRLCLSKNKINKVPFSKPENYDSENYEVLYRYIRAGIFDLFGLTRELPEQKADHNNWGAFNTDYIGGNYDWPDGDYKTRERIFQNHYDYQRGIFYFCANDPRLPSVIHQKTRYWGLASDEFTETQNWPEQLYIREARRMISDYVLTEHDAIGKTSPEDSVGMGSYRMDSHNCKRVIHAGRTLNEGDVEMSPLAPFPVPYRTIIPKRNQCTNLIVPVCISASHVAYGAVRMEPVFMILGQSAGIAAVLSMKKNNVVQDISYSDLENLLHEVKQFTFEPSELKRYRISSEPKRFLSAH